MSRPRISRSPWTTLAITAVATAALGGPIRKILVKRGLMDVPNHRSSHAEPIVRGGGVAGLAAAGIAGAVNGNVPSSARVGAIVGLAAIGLADDTTGHVPTSIRLGAQLVSGSLLLAQPGAGRVVDGVVTAGVVNVVNFMDGINGISGLTAAVWGVNAILLEDEALGQLAILGALTAGAGLGFLPHNLPTAKMFLGDAGSYAFGSAMAAGILSQRTMHGRYSAAAPLLLYGVDAMQALIKRGMAGQNIGEAHRDHVYQRLVDSGISHMDVALLHAVGGALIAAATRLTPTKSLAASAAVTAIYLSTPRINGRQASTGRLRARVS